MLPDLAAVLVAASLGAMLFFSGVIAPTVFQALPEQQAGAFLRAMFPKYFLINGAIGLVAGALLFTQPVAAGLLIATGGAMIAVRYALIPRINAARDAWTGGDAAAKATFDRLHRVSVLVNVAEMAVFVFVIWRVMG